MRTNASPRRKLSRRSFRPLFEQVEDRRLLATWTVDDSFAASDPAHHKTQTIQEAVNLAHSGDTIKVNAGTYEENVLVDKKLTIQGNNLPVVDPVDDGAAGVPAYGFNLQANDIAIKGFRIGDFDTDEPADTDPDGSVGINTSNAFSGYKIQNNTIEQNVFGIYLNTSTSNSAKPSEVSGNTIRNNDVGAGVLPAAGNGIYSDQGARKVTISGNTFAGHDNEDVIFVAPSALQNNLTIQKNTLEHSSGIFFINVQNSTIASNKIVRSNFNAIELAGGNVGVTVKGNNLQDVGIQGYTGIYLNDAYGVGPNVNNLILGNSIVYDGLSGIRVRDSNFNVVKGNTVIGSSGFDLSDPAWGNGIGLENAQNNTVDSNTVKLNARHGIYVDSLSGGNLIKSNVSLQNAQVDTSAFDYNDDSNGTGTADTANTYQNNTGHSQSRPGLIKHHV